MGVQVSDLNYNCSVKFYKRVKMQVKKNKGNNTSSKSKVRNVKASGKIRKIKVDYKMEVTDTS